MGNKEKNLVIQFLEGTCNQDEARQIEEWKNKSAENAKLLNDYTIIWNETDKLSSKYGTINLEEELEKYLTKIQTEDFENLKQSNKPIRIEPERLNKFRWIRYAALVIALVGFGLLANLIIKNKINRLFTEIEVPFGSKSQISLPDGTIVWLNAGSKLKYKKDFNNETRQVYLEGEGYFIVAKDSLRPFLVEASNLSIRALGTEFNVKCYAGEGTVETTLIEGSVKVSENRKEDQLEDVILKPNQKLIFIKKTGKLFLSEEMKNSIDSVAIDLGEKDISKERKEQVIVKTIDPLPVISWKEDKLILTGERFEEVKIKLERWYDVEIDITDSSVLNLQFKGTFQKESVGQALEALKMAAPFNYKVDKKIITISK